MFKGKGGKGKEKDEAKASPTLTSKLKKRTPSEREARRKGPYVADFDRSQTFDLDIDPKVKRPFNSGKHTSHRPPLKLKACLTKRCRLLQPSLV